MDGVGQVAPDGRGRLLAPFHKEGLQLPPRPGAPELTSPIGLEEAPAAASSGGFHSSQTHLPDTPSAQGYLLRSSIFVSQRQSCQTPLKSATLSRAGGWRQLNHKREKTVLKVGQGRMEVSDTEPLKLESACKSPGNLVKCRFCFSCCGVSRQGNRLPGVASPAHWQACGQYSEPWVCKRPRVKWNSADRAKGPSGQVTGASSPILTRDVISFLGGMF